MVDLSKKLTRGLVKLSIAALPRQAGIAVGHRLRAREELRRANQADAIVLSHAKSGRTWLRVMLSRLFQVRYGLPENELMEFDNWSRVNPAVPTFLYTHGHYLGQALDESRPPAVEPLAEPRVEPRVEPGWARKPTVFLARHPCDVAVSQYFHWAKRTKQYKKELHGVADDALSMYDFVMASEQGLPEIVDYLNAWQRRLCERRAVLFVTYEAMREHTAQVLGDVARFLGITCSENDLAAAVEFGAFEALKEKERTNFFRNSRLTPGDPDDADSFKVRRAVVGGFRDYFSEPELARMEAFVAKELAPFYGYLPDRPR